MIDLAVIIIYTLALLVIFIYSLSQLHLLINYLKATRTTDDAEKFDFSKENLPQVTIQLPLYNEYYVVERLLKNIGKITYPKDKLEIQVLDDSTDHSIEKTEEIIQDLQSSGLDIQHIRRVNRSGFKAGASKRRFENCQRRICCCFRFRFCARGELVNANPSISLRTQK